MAKHTPGIWKVFKSDVSTACVFADGIRIAEFRTSAGWAEELDGNMRLVSCAPDMLNLLKAIFSGVKQTERPGNLILHADEIQAIRTMIEKIEDND